VLIDSRHEPQKIDLEFMYFIGEQNIPFCILFTKADKLKPSQLSNNIKHYSKTMTDTHWEYMPPYFITSSVSEKGKEEVLNYIDDLNKSLK
jgi:GTP-binding protein